MLRSTQSRSAAPRPTALRRPATRLRAAVLIVPAALALAAGCASTKTATTSGAGSSPAAFAAPGDPSARIAAANLPSLDGEKFTRHDHDLLVVKVGDQPVTVPADIGIDNAHRKISPLHTHDTTGILHIEAGDTTPITLGQFFTEWGVRLDASCLGDSCSSGTDTLRVTVDDQPVPDGSKVVLGNHQRIMVFFGPATTPVPTIPTAVRWP